LEEAMDLSQDRLLLDLIKCTYILRNIIDHMCELRTKIANRCTYHTTHKTRHLECHHVENREIPYYLSHCPLKALQEVADLIKKLPRRTVVHLVRRNALLKPCHETDESSSSKQQLLVLWYVT
jgi:hypothetical protein